MLCQNCKKNSVNTHITKTENGKTAEYFLCSKCAKNMGLNPFEQISSEDFLGDFFSKGMLLVSANKKQVDHSCEMCNTSFSDILGSGKIGCANCYETFKIQLEPSIRRIHGSSVHTGKMPQNAKETIFKQKKVKELKIQLTEAIQTQEFEKAAQLRDEINELERTGQDHV